jgi:hypothetical protein
MFPDARTELGDALTALGERVQARKQALAAATTKAAALRPLPALLPPIRLAPAPGWEDAESPEAAERLRQLGRLAHDVWDLRSPLVYVQDELHRLVAREQVQPLSREEIARGSMLRRERAALWRRLRVYAMEYERLRPAPP